MRETIHFNLMVKASAYFTALMIKAQNNRILCPIASQFSGGNYGN